MKDKQFYAILLAFTGLFSLLPFALDDYNLHVVIVCLFYTMMASSWNLLAGYTGQVSFAHAAFAGIGAYTSGILAAKAGFNPWVGVGIGVVAAAVLGLGVGVLCLRMGGIYLSLTTLGFSEILHIIITNEYEFTRGTMGLQVPGLIANYSKSAYLYIFLAGTLITLMVIYKLIHSNVGLNFRAVQNDERAAASLGVNVVRVRVLAFTPEPAVPGAFHDGHRWHGIFCGTHRGGLCPGSSLRIHPGIRRVSRSGIRACSAPYGQVFSKRAYRSLTTTQGRSQGGCGMRNRTQWRTHRRSYFGVA
ncbi:MAG: branched-chain amino acid ABC transporter permease [Deltaproteobacteria bacterium]|nr:branched-chain amino acid ABC transporter permease [Deltaproteobacteria bacterium]